MKGLYIGIIILLVLCSCGNKEVKETPKTKIGEYLYIDQYKCAHVNQNCLQLMFSGENEKPNYMVSRVEVGKLNYMGKTCSVCITDEIFKELRDIIKRNNEYKDSIY